ncbi:hypothetical protein [Microtetraspora fusca]|nr:hypothetical protein [Microtetraspora fusca]
MPPIYEGADRIQRMIMTAGLFVGRAAASLERPVARARTGGWR